MPNLHCFFPPGMGSLGPKVHPLRYLLVFQHEGTPLQCPGPHRHVINSVMMSGVDASAGHCPGGLLCTPPLPKKNKKGVLFPGHGINKDDRHSHELLCQA